MLDFSFNMHPDLVQLVQLQEIDQHIARLTAEIASLPARLKAAESRLAAARAALAAAETALKTEEAARRRMESDIKDHKARIAKYKDQTNTVKNNDQYKALLHEIEFAETAIRQIEDRELESMERTEIAEAAKAQAASDLQDQQKIAAREQETAHKTHADDQAELTKLRARQSELRPGIDPATLKIYDRVAASRKTGLAEASGQRCSACQMMVRPQKWNELRADVLLTCESCGRLLYYVPTYDSSGSIGSAAPPVEIGSRKHVQSVTDASSPQPLQSQAKD